MTYHVRGIILRREAWRDAARLYTVYTREAGKLLAVGRGTRRVLSKLGPHLEPFSVVDLHLARGRRTETICGAIMVRPPDPLAEDDHRYLAASFAAEAVDHFVKTGDPDEELWRLIDAWYADLADLPSDRVAARLSAFTWLFMAHLGYRPKLDACAECGRPPSPSSIRLLPQKGVIVCGDCHLPESDLVGAVMMRPGESSLEAALALLEIRLDRPLSSLPLIRAILKDKAYA